MEFACMEDGAFISLVDLIPQMQWYQKRSQLFLLIKKTNWQLFVWNAYKHKERERVGEISHHSAPKLNLHH